MHAITRRFSSACLLGAFLDVGLRVKGVVRAVCDSVVFKKLLLCARLQICIS